MDNVKSEIGKLLSSTDKSMSIDGFLNLVSEVHNMVKCGDLSVGENLSSDNSLSNHWPF